MIYPQELMVNNYVFSIKNNMIDQIHSIMPDSIKLWCNPLAIYGKSDINPVPLTDEILVKSGFKKVTPRRGVQAAYLIKGIRIEKSNSGLFYYKGNVIKLHILQNLYWAHYQEELEVVL